MNDFFQAAARSQAALNRAVESLGVPFADPFNEEAIIVDVNDPDNKGRIKVLTSDNFTSDFIPLSGSGRGRLSAKFIGSKVLVSKVDGRSENMYAVGILNNSPEVGLSGTPVQIPIIDESLGVYSGSADQGMQCNKGNEGRVYILSNEMNQDMVVCLRRTSPQTGSSPKWAWKSLTNGLWVEKGINPGNEGEYIVSQDHRLNPGTPQCDESLLGEIHEFTEDRGFRTIQKRCQRDENGAFSWIPVGAPPTYFRTTLPTCTESIHGMQAVLDDGNNSEVLTCQRYDKKMQWIRNGKRLPQKFYEKGSLLTKGQFLSSFNPIQELEETADSPLSGFDWVAQSKEISQIAVKEAVRDIPLTGTDPRLRISLAAVGLASGKVFSQSDALTRIANAAVGKQTGIPVSELVGLLRDNTDDLDSAAAKVLEGIGEAGDILLNGVQTGTEQQALEIIGQRTLQAAVTSLDPQAASVVTGLMTGGVVGALDSAVALGLSKLPEEADIFVKPIIDAAQNVLRDYPVTLNDLVNSAVSGGLDNKVSDAINKAIGLDIVNPTLLSDLSSKLLGGELGDVSSIFSSVNGLDSVLKMPGELGSLPLLASSVMGLFGQEGSLSKLFGKGGLGLEGVGNLLGDLSPVLTLLGGLGGLFGGGAGGGACPCGPKCRKTKHGEDSDGNKLLDPCKALTANNANSYKAVGIPVPNNTGPVALDQGLINTLVGSNLIPPNPINLTSSINTIPRVGQMASRFHNSRYADEIEHLIELAYTFEATEKAFKVADNNITRIESIERKLIDAMFNLINNFICNKKKDGGLSVMTELIRDARENAQAIKDLYAYVKRIDLKKRGKKVGVTITPSIAKSIQNITSLSKLSASNCVKATKVLNGAIIPAHKEWLTMEPGNNFSSVLGTYAPDIPAPFPNEVTIFNQARVINESVLAKVGGNDPQAGDTINSLLSPRQAEALQRTEFSSVPRSVEEAVRSGAGIDTGADTITGIGTSAIDDAGANGGAGVESLYDRIVSREGQTDCEQS